MFKNQTVKGTTMRFLKTLGVLLILLLSFGSVGAGEDQLTLDQIIERYTEAIGGVENIKKIENLVYSQGKYREGDYVGSGQAMMSMARPWFKLVGDKNRPNSFMEGYDGSAWEYFGNPRVVIRTDGPPSEAIRHYAGVERPLFEYWKKGSSAVLLGETTLGLIPVYVIKLIRRDGHIEQFYLDKESFLALAVGGEAPIHAFGPEVETLTRLMDYREVAGVLIAHRNETVHMPGGEPFASMQWGKVEANVVLPDDWFSPPEFTRTREEKLIEDLYGQRADWTSILWTYEEFRRGFPEIDTTTPVNIAGFQILKMGQVENAIRLLEINTKDNPDSAETRFGLGRAYRTGGRFEEAKEQFEMALEINPAYERAKKALEELED